MYNIIFITIMAAVGLIAAYIFIQMVRCCFEKKECTSCVLPNKKN